MKLKAEIGAFLKEISAPESVLHLFLTNIQIVLDIVAAAPKEARRSHESAEDHASKKHIKKKSPRTEEHNKY